MIDVVALGELLIDFATISIDGEGYPTMAAHPGGAPANFLAALTKFGAKTALMGKVGTDTFGKLLLGTVKDAGISAGASAGRYADAAAVFAGAGNSLFIQRCSDRPDEGCVSLDQKKLWSDQPYLRKIIKNSR